MASLLFSATAFASTLAFAPLAHAEAPESPPPGAPSVARGFGLSLTPMVAEIKLGSDGTFSPYVALDVSPSYRFSRTFSLALHGTYGTGPEETFSGGDVPPGTVDQFQVRRRFLRVSLEPRVHVPVAESVDLWFGGEVGVFDLMNVSPESTDHNRTPLLGAAAGVDLFAAKQVSLGFEARATIMPFPDVEDDPAYPNGTSVGLYGGLVLSLHLPTGD